jgi:hypothetical protein
MFTVKGFVKFLELLPVLAMVEAHPRRKKYKGKKKPKLPKAPQICAMCKEEFDLPRQLKYCSKECRVKASTLRNQLTNDYTKIRTCAQCGGAVPLGKRVYCSEECKKEQVLANVRNPFSGYGTKSDEWVPHEAYASMPMYSVAPDVLAKAEAYVEDYPSGIREDMAYIYRAMEEELPPPKFQNGTRYYSVRHKKNRQRQQEGKEPAKLTGDKIYHLYREKAYEKARKRAHKKRKEVAFSTLGYSPRTKSGKLKSEILADVKRK